MPTTPDKDGTRAGRALGALLVLPALCCGLPLLIAGGSLGALAAVPGTQWTAVAAVAVVAGVVLWRINHPTRSSPSGGHGCCADDPPAGEQARPSAGGVAHPESG